MKKTARQEKARGRKKEKTKKKNENCGQSNLCKKNQLRTANGFRVTQGAVAKTRGKTKPIEAGFLEPGPGGQKTIKELLWGEWPHKKRIKPKASGR